MPNMVNLAVKQCYQTKNDQKWSIWWSNSVTRQELIKPAKNGQFGCQLMLPDRSLLIGQKLVKNAKIKKIQMRHFWSVSNNVY